MPQDRTDLPIGETIDVKLRSAVVTSNAPLIVDMDGEQVTVPTGGDGIVDIDVVAPLNWPPQMGDVWEDGVGTKWFGVQVDDNGVLKIRLQPETGGLPQNYQTVKTEHRPLSLVYRTE